MEEFNNFSSNDFYLSAVCIASGCKLIGLDRQRGNFVDFVFEEPPEHCFEIIRQYFADELTLNPRKLVEAINTLKTRLHSGV